MTGWELANTVCLSIGLLTIVAGGLLGLGASFTNQATVAKARGNLALVLLGAGASWIVIYAAVAVMIAIA